MSDGSQDLERARRGLEQLRAAAVRRAAHRTPGPFHASQIVESGPDLRAGARKGSLLLALLAIAIALAGLVSMAAGDPVRWPDLQNPLRNLPEFNFDRPAAPEVEPAVEPIAEPPSETLRGPVDAGAEGKPPEEPAKG